MVAKVLRWEFVLCINLANRLFILLHLGLFLPLRLFLPCLPVLENLLGLGQFDEAGLAAPGLRELPRPSL